MIAVGPQLQRSHLISLSCELSERGAESHLARIRSLNAWSSASKWRAQRTPRERPASVCWLPPSRRTRAVAARGAGCDSGPGRPLHAYATRRPSGRHPVHRLSHDKVSSHTLTHTYTVAPSDLVSAPPRGPYPACAMPPHGAGVGRAPMARAWGLCSLPPPCLVTDSTVTTQQPVRRSSHPVSRARRGRRERTATGAGRFPFPASARGVARLEPACALPLRSMKLESRYAYGTAVPHSTVATSAYW